jgi:hypothetical protein
MIDPEDGFCHTGGPLFHLLSAEVANVVVGGYAFFPNDFFIRKVQIHSFEFVLAIEADNPFFHSSLPLLLAFSLGDSDIGFDPPKLLREFPEVSPEDFTVKKLFRKPYGIGLNSDGIG